MKKFNYNQCGKYLAKAFKLKVHIQNIHEIEKIRYESINDIMEIIRTFRNLQNLNLKGGSLAKSRKLFFSGEVIFGGQNPKNAKKNFKKFYCPKSFVRSYRSFLYL